MDIKIGQEDENDPFNYNPYGDTDDDLDEFDFNFLHPSDPEAENNSDYAEVSAVLEEFEEETSQLPECQQDGSMIVSEHCESAIMETLEVVSEA